MNLETAFQPQRHRDTEEDSRGYTETAVHLPGEQTLRGNVLYFRGYPCLCVSVVNNPG